ncbi:hypothetical protein [uncultured Bacteroides sp.]|uniref:hypothetical protein n=1 Tax=uncultured Bacteroides sp. TaxID=162156 RepID=UPI0025D36AF5|nr:hypothetical protein [uncultured Bacteroides sp.]
MEKIKRFVLSVIHFIFGDWTSFLIGQRHGRKEVMKRHYLSAENPSAVNDVVIHMVNGYSWHGGLCDRIKGVVTVYNWCKKHNKVFKTFFIYPFDLSDYLIPNRYDWKIDSCALSYNPRQTNVCYMMYNGEIASLLQDGRAYKLTDRFFDRKLLKRKQIHVYTNAQTCADKEFRVLFNELFKPAPRLQQLIDYHLERIGGTYISISFRFTTLLGDFNDCTGPALPEQERQPLIDKCLKAINDISSIAPLHDRILLTADSCTFLRQAAKLPNVYVIPGKVGHIDYESNDDVNMKTFLDFLLISKAEAVYLGKSGKMYKSAFAQTASMVNNRPFNIIEF